MPTEEAKENARNKAITHLGTMGDIQNIPVTDKKLVTLVEFKREDTELNKTKVLKVAEDMDAEIQMWNDIITVLSE